jgi:hypothetical protein
VMTSVVSAVVPETLSLASTVGVCVAMSTSASVVVVELPALSVVTMSNTCAPSLKPVSVAD